MQYFTIICAT